MKKLLISLLLGIVSLLSAYSRQQTQELPQWVIPFVESSHSIMLFPLYVQSQISGRINPEGSTIAQRIRTPKGYYRDSLPPDSFGYFLRHFPLEPHGTKVVYYNGQPKRNPVYVAVLKADVGTRDLQQCADAVIRLRAEYLYACERYADIHFNFTNGFRADYSKWAEGFRIRVNGNRTEWYKAAAPDSSYANFRRYLNVVFAYAGTLSLSRELATVPYTGLQPGDVFIQGGSPGHAVIVMDVAVNPQGHKLYLLAQSYKPAQSIHVLKNPNDPALSPWYSLSGTSLIRTPEWNFTSGNLKRFK